MVKLWFIFKTAMIRPVLDSIREKELHIFSRLKTPQITLDSELVGVRSSTHTDTLVLLELLSRKTFAHKLWVLPSELCSTQTRLYELSFIYWLSNNQSHFNMNFLEPGKSHRHAIKMSIWVFAPWRNGIQSNHWCPSCDK